MACCNCCTNTLNLGCFDACSVIIDTGIVADLTNEGTWILSLEFGRRTVYYSADIVAGDNVIFTLDSLNESYTYVGQIIDPNGTVISINQGGTDYDCIQFTTKITQ
jgi:hypothetical protein